ncbi:hypothetical protein F2Q68_00036182 [Brassica cretica]|uniref:Uncharacterized protein n=1 Tax=Brassica cretica TaxID=69181 RepID=A0A8S9H8L7_BRACR|nr:hypothetical protein F2Q68_00036182 [Brassica cretica]
MKIPRNTSSELPRTGPSENPSKYPEEVLLGIFRGPFRRTGGPQKFISEGFPRKNEFPRSYFRGLVSSVCRRNNVIPTTYRRFFPSVCRCFLVVMAESLIFDAIFLLR